VNKLKSLWNDHRALFLVIVAILLLVLILLVLGRPDLLLYLAIAAIVLIVAWLALDSYVRSRKRRKQEELDTRIAAKEGVDDRRREWTRWTKELRQQGIDRYELPFYLLVGEPQSGKSVMLHNSGLHFPFGQSRLSGPGGTRGCDWWFTEEAVILDLAGRLFTHEGGASDAAEWEAFLELLASYRPLSPANGVLLVIPCDSLLEDSPEVVARKASQIQDSLLTLVGKLQAQLPIYLVLTKADRVFGFAETVHKMDTDRRRQMFGWSRPAEDFEKPFDLAEFRRAFAGLQHRAHLLRAQAMSTALIPDALPEIDRLFAFPEEMKALEAPLEAYVQRIFTESSLVDRLFFRGVYLTSGLQKGAPIAKACAALLGGSSEADSRDLEGLFGKQRAYFIHDLIQRRVFSERGLVRPTSQRVLRARRIALAGYGAAAGIALMGTVWTAITAFSQKPDAMKVYADAIARTEQYIDLEPAGNDLAALVDTLLEIRRAEQAELPSQLEAGVNNRGDFRELYRMLFEKKFASAVREAAEGALVKQASVSPAQCSVDELMRLGSNIGVVAPEIDLSSTEQRGAIVELLEIDSTCSELVADRRSPDDESRLPSPFALCVDTLTEYGGELPKSAFAPSGDLRIAGNGFLALLDHYAKGELGSPAGATSVENLTDLECVIRLARGQTRVLQAVADLRKAKAEITSQTAAAADTNRYRTFLEVDDRLEEELSELTTLIEDIEKIDRAEVRTEYEDIEKLHRAVVDGTGATDREAGWKELGDFIVKEFFTERPENRRVVWWEMAPEGTTSRAKSSVKRFVPSFGGGVLGRAGRELLGDAASNAAAAVPTDKPVLGFVRSEKPDDIRPLSAEERKSLRDTCGNEVMTGREPRPRSHLAAIEAVWEATENAPDSDRALLLRTQVSDLQRVYVDFYREHSSSFGALADALVDRTEAPAEEPGTALGVHPGAVRYLADLHSLLVELDPDHRLYGEWLGEIEKRLEQQLQELGAGLEAAGSETFSKGIDPNVADTLCLLSTSFAESAPSISSEASRSLATYLDDIQSALLASWKTPGTDLEGVVAGLRSYVQGYADLPSPPQDHGSARDRWLEKEVDPLVVGEAAEFEQRLVEYWRGLANENLPDADWRKASQLVAERFGPGAGFGLRSFAEDPNSPRLAPVEGDLELIEKNLPSEGRELLRRSIKELGVARGRLNVDEAMDRIDELLRQGDFRLLADHARDLSNARAPKPESLIELLGDIERSLRVVADQNLGDGIGTYCADTLQLYRESLRKEYAALYQRAFSEEIVAANERLLRSPLFVGGSKDWTSVDSSTVSRLHGLLAPQTGSLAELQKEFHVAEIADAASEEDAEAFHPLQGSPELAALEDFLLSLRQFLYYDVSPRSKLEERSISFTLEATGAFWKDVASNQYWWPTKDRDERIELGPQVQKFEIKDWVIRDRDAGIDMAWGASLERPVSKPGLFFKIPSSLAPLILAWQYSSGVEAKPVTDWDLKLRVPDLDGTIGMRISFDQPLPPRPDGLELARDRALRAR